MRNSRMSNSGNNTLLAAFRVAIVLLAWLGMAQSAFSQNSELRIEVSQIEEARGQLMLAVYSPRETFMADESYLGLVKPVLKEGVMVVDLSLPTGKYAVTLYHDIDGDKELATNFFGIPKEPYGFSNDAMGTLGPPSFEQAAFTLGKEGKSIRISLK